MPKQVSSPILRALSLPTDPSKSSLSSSGGGSGFSETGSIRALVTKPNGEGEEERKFFLKIASGREAEEMFHGEYESLNAIAGTVEGFCPKAEAWGEVSGGRYFLATQFLELGGGGRKEEASLARKLGKLHSTPAPVVGDEVSGEKKRMFGFPVPTFCGDVKQPNRYRESWAEFYAEERLLNVLKESERRNGKDKGLRDMVEDTVGKVVPRLLGDGHLGFKADGEGEPVVPVVVHGDLWSGNVGSGRISGVDNDDKGGKVFDPSACYAHSEFELGIMNMFGGFGARFFDEYHRIVPKTEPVEEYPDRIRLYEL
jgi:protein-ribulosamine 3-kinase